MIALWLPPNSSFAVPTAEAFLRGVSSFGVSHTFPQVVRCLPHLSPSPGCRWSTHRFPSQGEDARASQMVYDVWGFHCTSSDMMVKLHWTWGFRGEVALPVCPSDI